VKFIFATTEPHKLPDTILSRCQRHNFRRIGVARMLARLQEICRAEGVTISDRALAQIVRQSEGGMRDALSLLDQVLSACGASASDEAVADALGTIDQTAVHEICAALVRRDGGRVMTVLEELYERGVDFKRLAEELALELRHLFVGCVTGEAPKDLAESEQKAVMELSRSADAAQLARLFDVTHASTWDLSRTTSPKLVLEVALLKGIHLAPSASIPELVSRLEALGKGLPLPTKEAVASPPPSAGAPGGRSASPPFRA
jgi:DNA polymerase-3 subunit gamma/tau